MKKYTLFLKRNRRRFYAAMAIIATVAIVVIMVVSGDGGRKTNADATTTTASTTTVKGTSPSTTVVDPAAGDLKVRPGDILPDRAKCQSDEFLNNSLRPIKAGDAESLQTSDAVSTPFKADGSDPDKVTDETIAQNCGNPTVLDMNIRAFMALDATPTFNIGKENPWMGECLQVVEDNKGSLREAFLTKKTGTEGIFVTEQHQQCAELFNTIFLDFQSMGQQSLQSVENMHVDKRTAGELPRTELNPQQESLPAFVYEYTIKAGCSTLRIGFNVQDMRFERFEVPCKAPPTTTPTTRPPSTTTPCNCGTSTTAPGTTVPDTTGPTTTVPHGKPGVPSTLAPPPVTAPPTATTVQSGPTTSIGDSGPGAPPPATTVAPTPTVAPPGTIPATTVAPPTTRVEF